MTNSILNRKAANLFINLFLIFKTREVWVMRHLVGLCVCVKDLTPIYTLMYKVGQNHGKQGLRI